MLRTWCTKYVGAIVRQVPASLPARALRKHVPKDVCSADLGLARHQHDSYVRKLAELVPNIIELPPIEEHPDCVFVEDTAVVVDGTALIARMGHSSRRGEEVAVAKALEENKVRVLHMTDFEDAHATLDGGDVMYTGRELLVGLSARTNAGGVAALQRTFPHIPVRFMEVSAGLHLKSTMSMVSKECVAIVDTPESHKFVSMLRERHPYQVLWVDENEWQAANTVLCNGHLLIRPEYEETAKKLRNMAQANNLKCIEVEASEVEKVDGLLTCCSILF